MVKPTAHNGLIYVQFIVPLPNLNGFWRVAQLVEHWLLMPRVIGSNPIAPAMRP